MLGRLAVAAGFCLLVVLQQAQALGLGRIQVQSGLNQRFSAVVPLVSLSDQEAVSVRARMAENAAFARAGLERSAYVSTIEVSVVTDDGSPRVVMSSQSLAREPLLNLLLEVRTAGGPRIFRQFTVLLDPPLVEAPVAPAESAADAGDEPQASEEAFYQAPKDLLQDGSPAAAATPAPADEDITAGSAPAGSDARRYGPVRKGDALWRIATAVKPPEVGLHQAMLALFEANPAAFIDGDINQMRTGVELTVPSVQDMQRLRESRAASRVRELSQPAQFDASADASVAEPAVDASMDASTGAGGDPAYGPGPSDPVPRSATQATQATKPPSPTVAESDPAGPSGDPAAGDEVAGATEPAPAGQQSLAPAADPMVSEPGTAAGDPGTGNPAPAADDAAMYDEDEIVEGPAQARSAAESGSESLLQRLLVPLLIGLAVILMIVWMIRARRRSEAQQAYEDAHASSIGSGPVPRRSSQSSTPMPATAPDEAEDEDDTTRVGQPTAAAGLAAAAVAADRARTARGNDDNGDDDDNDRTVMQPQAQTAGLPAYGVAVGEPDGGDSTASAAEADADARKLDLGDNDPLSEAEFHIAYGLYEEAALLLQQASAQEPARTELRVKLAETYFAAGMPEQFLETARPLRQELDETAWGKVAIMGRQVCPGESLFAGVDSNRGKDLDFDLAVDTPSDVPVTTVDEGLEFRLEELELPSETTDTPAQASTENTLEFDLGEFDLSGTEVRAPNLQTSTQVSLDDFDLAGGSKTSGPGDDHLDLSLSDLDSPSEDPFGDDEMDTGNDSGTKLDLARAYVEMGDTEVARSLLDEVTKSGTSEQKAEAEALRARLAG